ncbi:MAG: hypothetical protein EOP09_01380 [Proteobacteria bacterium]|nr:MAG: hypothetical protein EOP09_01380 [Pseudomonadota bacterium]
MVFSLTTERIDRDLLISQLRNEQAGALVTFEGWVRNHNGGKSVSSLEYQVYSALALKEGQRILDEAREKFNLHSVVCTHRFGHLKVGDAAVWIGAVATHRVDAFQATRFVIDEIKTRLPIWKKEHYLNESAEWVYCKDHSTHVHFEEAAYYQKQKNLIDQTKLKRARVLVVGAGGLGCPVLSALTTAGVGHITVIDHDRVSLSNLHRQPLYGVGDVGEKKAVVARIKLQTQNPFIEIESLTERLDSRNITRLLVGFDLVLDCTDNLETKFLVHDACRTTSTALIAASVYRLEGQIRSYIPGHKSGCLRCLQATVPHDEQLGNCNDFGVLGATVAVVGSMQAHEALMWLSQSINSTSDATLFLNLQSLTQRKIKNIKNPACTFCSKRRSNTSEMACLTEQAIELDLDELPEAHQLVDIREVTDSYLDRFDQVPENQVIVVYCHRGIRSRRLVETKRAQGYRQFFSLRGGACSL